MDLSKSRELREQRKKMVVDAQALPATTKEEIAIVNRMLDDAELLKGQIDILERADSAGQEFRGTRTPPPNGQPGNTGDPEAEKKRDDERFHKAWLNSMKFGMQRRMTSQGKMIFGISEEDRTALSNRAAAAITAEQRESINVTLRMLGQPELRDMGSGNQGAYPGATTGFFVPVGFVNRIEDALKYYGPMLNGGPGLPEIYDTATGQQLPFPTDNDTTVTGELVGENQQVTTADVALGQIIMGAYKYSSKMVKISIELLQDSAFNLEDFLVRKFGMRLGRILNQHFTTGTGSGQPNGIVTASTLGVAAIGSALNDGTSASTNTIGSDDMINLEHSVDPLYRPGAMYMFHDATLRALKNIKDKYGRPLWLPGLAVQAPDTINGYSYLINNDMTALQTSASSPVVVNKTVLFGQISKYLIRRVKELSVLRLEERFADGLLLSPAI